MNIQCTQPIDRTLWLQYLQGGGGAGTGQDPQEDMTRQLADQMDEAEKLLLETAEPRWVYRVLDRSQIPVEGISVEKHLEGCAQAAILAVTLGSAVDELIRRSEITNMVLAMVLDTGASVLVEQAADLAEQEMKTEIAGKLPASFTTSRFSPGYGDYPIRHQREILRLVDAGRRAGITLTAGDMMVPHKSVTAVVGIADHPVQGRLATCEECLLREKCRLWPQNRHC